jgi:predicted esterase
MPVHDSCVAREAGALKHEVQRPRRCSENSARKGAKTRRVFIVCGAAGMMPDVQIRAPQPVATLTPVSPTVAPPPQPQSTSAPQAAKPTPNRIQHGKYDATNAPSIQRFKQLLDELGVEHEYAEVSSGHCGGDWEGASLKYLSERLVFEE